MQVSVESPSNLGRKLVISVPSEKIENAVTDRVKELAKKVRIDGFRPGKVPAKVVEQRFGSGIREEVARDLLQSSLFDAIQQNDLRPAGTPKVDPGDIKPGEDFEFTATFEVFPELEVNALDGVEVEQIEAEVQQSDIDSMVEKLLAQNKEWHVAEKAAANGDKVKINFDGYKDGEPFEGGKAENYDLELGSGSMVPGFEEQIEGMKVGDHKELEITFPEDYGHKDLAGQQAIFKIDVLEVQEGKNPELNEEFIKKFSQAESVDAFLDEVKTNMDRELSRSLKAKNKDSVFTAFLAKNPCELPEALVKNEIEQLKQDMVKRVFGDQKVDPKTLPALPDDMFKAQADKRVHLGLVFAEYVKAHDIKPEEERVDAWLQELSSSYDKPQELLDWYRGSKDRMAEIESAVLEEQAVEKMLADATVKTVSQDYDTVMNPKAAETEEDTAEEEQA